MVKIMNKDILLLNSDATPLSFLPLSTINWKEAIQKLFSDEIDVIEEYDWIVHSPSMEYVVPSVVLLRNYIKVPRKVQYNRDNVYLRDDYTCQYCGYQDLSRKDLTLDHVIPKFHGGKTRFNNIVTACQNCNAEKAHYMKMKPIEIPKNPTYYDLIKNRKKYDIIIPTSDWIPYIGWDENKIILN